MVLGALLISGAVALALWNQKENAAAQKTVDQITLQLMQQIQDNAQKETVSQETTPELQKPVSLLTEEDKAMTEVEIDGHRYIGYISIPALDIELPIMSTWSYSKLRIAPCRYSGSLRGEDLVLMAHNYKSHFGTISRLEMGDEVLFTDMDGRITRYAVVGKDVLSSSATDVIESGEYDLTLFTCTYGGASRVTVYCDFAK